jgi:hypothetical protein
MTKPDFDVHYADSRTTLVLEADLSHGWRHLKKTFGFFRTKWVWFIKDTKIRTQLSFIAQPASLGKEISAFPAIERHWSSGPNFFDLTGERLIAKLPLNQERRILSTNIPGIYFEELGAVALGNLSFDLRILIAFHDPGMHKEKDEYDWDSKFLSGGLPGSKRSH